jgi:hypothetical protein
VNVKTSYLCGAADQAGKLIDVACVEVPKIEKRRGEEVKVKIA